MIYLYSLENKKGSVASLVLLLLDINSQDGFSYDFTQFLVKLYRPTTLLRHNANPRFLSLYCVVVHSRSFTFCQLLKHFIIWIFLVKNLCKFILIFNRVISFKLKTLKLLVFLTINLFYLEVYDKEPLMSTWYHPIGIP